MLSSVSGAFSDHTKSRLLPNIFHIIGREDLKNEVKESVTESQSCLKLRPKKPEQPTQENCH